MINSNVERATPFKLSLCFLLEFLLSPRGNEDSNEKENATLCLSTRNVLSTFILDQIVEIEQGKEKSFCELKVEINRVSLDGLATTIISRLEKKIFSIQSPDDLINLICSLKEMLFEPQNSVEQTLPTHIEETSMFGLFLRSILLDCNSMRFGRLATFFDQIRAYCNAPSKTLDRTSASSAGPQEVVSAPILSGRQIQLSLQREAFAFEKDFGKESLESREVRIQHLLGDHPDLPRAHFLRYLSCTRHREFQGALDSLHQYFDYGLRRGGPNKTGDPSESRETLAHPSLHLATLHLEFGHVALAEQAFNETIRMAQQKGDHVTVAYALAWLHVLMHRSNHPQTSAVLQRCETKARTNNKFGLAVQAALLNIRHATLVGTPVLNDPERAIAQVLTQQRSDTASDAPLGAAPNAALDAFGPGMQLKQRLQGANQEKEKKPTPEPATVIQMAIDQSNIESGLWSTFGYIDMASIGPEALLAFYSDQASSEDIITASVKIAFSMFAGNRAFDEAKKGPLFPRALEFLEQVQAKFPHCESTNLPLSITLLKHEQAVLRGETSRARNLLSRLKSLRAPSPLEPSEEDIAITRQQIVALRAEGDFRKAMDLAVAASNECKKQGLKIFEAVFQLETVYCYVEGASKDIAGAIPSILQSLAMFKELSMVTFHAIATTLLAKLYFKMHNISKAIALQQEALPTVLQNAPIKVQGEVWLDLAKSYLAGYQQTLRLQPASDTDKVKNDVLNFIQHASESFAATDYYNGLKEALYIKARCLGLFGADDSLKNEVAQEFLECSSYVETRSH